MRLRTAAALVLASVLLAGCTGTQSTASPAASPTPTTSPSTTPSPSAVAFPCDGADTTVAVYYLGAADPDTAATGRLFREFHRLRSCPGGRIETAVTAMLGSSAQDPDYTSLWPAGTQVRSVARSGRVATVDLSDYPEVGASFEAASVQQLVWTVTAADPRVHRVRLTVDGQPPPTGHLDPTAFDARRGDSLDTLAHAWILRPSQGDTLGSPVLVRVYGTGFEGNVVLEVLQGSRVVRRTSVTTMMGGFATASTRLRLPAGSFTLKAYTDNGMDDSLALWDTKDFTVR